MRQIVYYDAVVYLKVIHSLSNFQVSFICAKTKIAQMKVSKNYISSVYLVLN